MGLIKQADWLRPRHPLRRQLEGIVVANDDPRMMSRVKVSIPGLLDTDHIEIDDLPWCYPQFPAEFGNIRSGSPMTTPVIGSTLLIEFPTENIYYPVYRWRAINRKTRPTDFQSEYPHRHGRADPEGNKQIINKAPGHAFQEERIQDGTHTFHDSERSTSVSTDPFGTIIEIDRPNQRLFARFANVEITISPDGVSINTPSLTINAEDALSLLASAGVNISSAEAGTSLESYLEQIANTIAANAGEEVE